MENEKDDPTSSTHENSFGVHFHHSDSNECEEMCLRDVTIMVHPEGITLVPFTESPSPPPNAICHGKEEYDIDCDGDLRLWSIIAHTPYGKIPGRGTKEEAYYCYDGQDYLTKDFSWIVSHQNSHLVRNKDCPIPPKNAIKVTSHSGITGTKPDFYFVIARTKDGLIPGMFNGTNAIYAYAGKERSANEFDWIVLGNVEEADGKDWFMIENELSKRVLEVGYTFKCYKQLITSKASGSPDQLWKWKGNTLISKSGYVVSTIGNEAGACAVAVENDFSTSQQWTMDGTKIVSTLNGMALDIKNGSIWSNKDIIIWTPNEPHKYDSQSWRFKAYQN